MKKSPVRFLALLALSILVLAVSDAFASDLHHQAEEIGKILNGYWIIPFVCMLLSIVIMPLATPHFWYHHFKNVCWCSWTYRNMMRSK